MSNFFALVTLLYFYKNILMTFFFCFLGYCAFVDAEHALDPALAESIGVDTNNLLLSQPDCAEQALSLVDTLIRSGSVDVVVVDSVRPRSI
jgi:RecA/RadA recombinase